MFILGINCFHGDSSACLISNGILLAAAEEERFRRVKHWTGFPSKSIQYCLEEAGISLSQVNHIAINQDPKANLGRKISYALHGQFSLRLIIDRLRNKVKRLNILQNCVKSFPDDFFSGRVHQIEHHLAHVSSAFYASPYDEAVVVSVDGFGDFSSTAWGFGKGVSIRVDGKVYFPHSLGIFYQALTQFLGFNDYGDEYKVMGLAPYGNPSLMSEMHELVSLLPDGSFELNLKYFCHHNQEVNYEWESGSPSVGCLFSSKLEELLGPPRKKGEDLTQRHKDIAHSVQLMYEEAFFHLLNALYERYNSCSIALAGGCAMNSVANGKISLRTPFKNIYVQSAAGDAGGAIGAALNVWHKAGGSLAKVRSVAHDHAYWGPSFTNEQIEEVLNQCVIDIEKEGCVFEKVNKLNTLLYDTAKSISDGHVVGWFQGRMEWGPRALGNRSILCDPRRSDMKDILNLKIKRRESFRPFAPSILREAVPAWFDQDGDVPFMMQVYKINPEKQNLIPAVTHNDGSGRLQTVYEHTNPRFYHLISTFRDLTGVPIILNTSFNENEPVVCTPKEALSCFLRTKMDRLIMGDWVIRRTLR
jgi:carbamoyltransferase